MAVSIGSIKEFDPVKEEWGQYAECMGHYFDANGVNIADKKRSAILAAIEASTYKLLQNLIASQELTEKSYSELVAVLTRHFNPPPSEILQ